MHSKYRVTQLTESDVCNGSLFASDQTTISLGLSSTAESLCPFSSSCSVYLKPRMSSNQEFLNGSLGLDLVNILSRMDEDTTQPVDSTKL